MKVRFLQDRELPDVAFKAGQEYDLVETSAQRWIRRGAAVEVTAEPAAAPEEAPRRKRGKK